MEASFFKTLPKERRQFLPTKGKDTLHVAPHKKRVDQRATRHRIQNPVPRQRATVLLSEGVFVNPLPIGPVQLLVHEAMGRFPFAYHSLPAQWHAMNAKFVIDKRARLYLYFARREDLEV